MSGAASFASHLRAVEGAATRALELAAGRGECFDTLVFHAGSADSYHADDLEIPFRTHPHFLRFAPISGPDHLMIYRPGERTRVLRAVASDFWYAPPAAVDDAVGEAIEIVEIETEAVADAFAQLGPLGRCAFVGEDQALAAALGIERACVEPPLLMAALDWGRAFKTDYEVACIREAQRIAGRGHAALRAALDGRPSEYELHLVYLSATQQLEAELPYPSIIAWDEAGAVLHYQYRRTQAPSLGRSLLVDAGARCRGYSSDITRTYDLAGDESPEFSALLDGMERLQQQLVEGVMPGADFVDLHRSAEVEIAGLLREVGVIRTSVEEARERGIVFAFFPHGLGHHLGLQVHDVGGRQADATGATREPPADCPHLRTTRELAPGHVITIEPGLYFIPSLLETLRAGPARDLVDWNLVDTLMPFGGIRIEDDVLVTEANAENLTRPHVPGHA